MPIIDGVKMACEPCIRGHRSTKCSHANERLMIPVRKPGRPLSICPHPTNNSCSCTTVTAALPRTRKCGCGPKLATSPVGKQPKPYSSRPFIKPSSPAAAPSLNQRSNGPPAGLPTGWSNATALPDAHMAMHTSSPPNDPYNMLDHPASSSFYATSCRPTAPLFALKNTDFQNGYTTQGATRCPDMYLGGSDNTFPPFFDGSNVGLGASLEQMPLPPAPGHGPNSTRVVDLSSSLGFTTQTQTPVMDRLDGVPVGHSRHNSLESLSQPPPETSMPAVAAVLPKRSCCGGGPKPTDPLPPSNGSANHTPTSSTSSLGSNAEAVASSASSSPPADQHTMKPERVHGDLESLVLSSLPLFEASAMQAPENSGGTDEQAESFSGSQSSVPTVAQQGQQQQLYPAVWYSYPAQYGTVSTPLRQSQWRDYVTTSCVAPKEAISAEAGVLDSHMQVDRSAPPPASSSFAMGNALLAETAENAHMCACGDDCDCVGCVAHPYNNATRNMVQSAWSSLVGGGTSGGATPALRPATTSMAMAGPMRPSTAQNEMGSPTQIPTPSDTSGTSDDQITLPSDNFLFVSYPLMCCEGEGATCPCGDDCQCIGCTIHNNAPS